MLLSIACGMLKILHNGRYLFFHCIDNESVIAITHWRHYVSDGYSAILKMVWIDLWKIYDLKVVLNNGGFWTICISYIQIKLGLTQIIKTHTINRSGNLGFSPVCRGEISTVFIYLFACRPILCHLPVSRRSCSR